MIRLFIGLAVSAACLMPAGTAAQSVAVLKKLKARYERVSQFDEGLALVVKNGKYGFVDTLGRVVVAPVYDQAGRFRNGCAFVSRQQRYALIDRGGRELTSFEWERLGHVNDGVTVGWKKEGDRRQYALIDTLGKITRLEQTVCEDFSNGLAAAGVGEMQFEQRPPGSLPREKMTFTGKYGYIDTKGAWVIPPRFDVAGKFGDDGLAPAGMMGKYYPKWGFIAREGNTVIPFDYFSVSAFERNRALVSKIVSGGRRVYGYIDRSGREAIPCRYDEATSYEFANTWVGTEQDGEMQYMLIDSVGNAVLPHPVLVLQDGGKYGQAACAVRGEDGKLYYGVVGNGGRTIVPFEYDRITIFSEWDIVNQCWQEAGIALKDGENKSFRLSRHGE